MLIRNQEFKVNNDITKGEHDRVGTVEKIDMQTTKKDGA